MRNLINPGGEFEFRAVAFERAIDLNEDLLRQIQCRVVVAHHAIDVGGDWPLVTAHEFIEPVLAPLYGACDQIAIGCGAQIKGDSVCTHALVLRNGNSKSFKMRIEVRGAVKRKTIG